MIVKLKSSLPSVFVFLAQLETSYPCGTPGLQDLEDHSAGCAETFLLTIVVCLGLNTQGEQIAEQ